MKTARVLFYKAKFGDGSWIDNGIDVYSYLVNPPYWKYRKIRTSHVELWTPDADDYYEDDCGNSTMRHFCGQCRTSTMGQARKRGAKYNGTCCRPAAEVAYHPERWFYAEIPVNDMALIHGLWFADKEIASNCGYDIKDIARYFTIGRTQNLADHKFICSGFVWAILKTIELYWYGLTDKACLTSMLYKLCGKRKKKDLPSPFRLACWLKEAGAVFYDLQTGKEIKP